MAELTNEILEKAGIITDLTGQRARRDKLTAQSDAKDSELAAQYTEIENKTLAKTTALAPLRENFAAKAKDVPSVKADEQPIPDYKRPTLDPKDMQESFGILLAASMLTGLASRQPFYTAANALTGAMNGFMAQDEKIVKQSMAEFDKTLQSIKERNAQKRRQVDDAFKKYANDLQALQSEMQIIAAQFDDPIALATARAKSIGEAKKLIDGNINKVDQTITRLEQTVKSTYESVAKLEESKARRAQAATHQAAMRDLALERLELARERDARAADAAAGKTDSRRFTDTSKLRGEYQKQTKDLRGDLNKIDRIIMYADRSGGFADNQLRQAITDFQKGSRGTNMMVESMKNFGSLDERVAGTLTRFLAGEYTPDQRDEILGLFRTLKTKVVQPSLEEKKAEYRFLATKNRLPVDEVVVDLGALDAGDAPAAPLAPAAPPRVTVTPRPR